MILIFGGAHQGKREYAAQLPGVKTVADCLPDFTADAVCGLEDFTLACTRQGVEAADWFRDRREQWQGKVLIIRDISQGIVPMDAAQRAWREMNGRLMIYLASEAEEVHRVFCGIGKRIR